MRDNQHVRSRASLFKEKQLTRDNFGKTKTLNKNVFAKT